jgi:hypothetical protein
MVASVMLFQIMLILASMDQIKASTRFDLPAIGFRFYYWVIFGLAVLYPYSGPTLYWYMLKQRSKKLRADGEKAAAKKKG